MKLRFFLMALMGLMLIAACDNQRCDADDQESRIQDYIQANSLVTQKTESGLHYIIEEEGSQIRPVATSTVTMSYKGYLTDGTVFDENSGIDFLLNGVIAGWTEGVQLFKKGGKGILIIPCTLGYGEQNRTRIPPGSVLIFEIEVLDVK